MYDDKEEKSDEIPEERHPTQSNSCENRRAKLMHLKGTREEDFCWAHRPNVAQI
jgi:hypothetical protein